MGIVVVGIVVIVGIFVIGVGVGRPQLYLMRFLNIILC